MLDTLSHFFQTLFPHGETSEFDPDDTRVLIVALCLQVMEADGAISKAERTALNRSVHDHFGLDGAKLEALLEVGQRVESEAVDYYRFTSELKRRLTEEQRLKLVGVLWDIVYADGSRSEIEDHILWRVADLLGVSDRDRVTSRQDAARRAGSTGEADAL